MLQGFQEAKPSADSRLPITPSILRQITIALQFTTKSAFLKKCWRLCLSLLFEHSWESERLLKHQAQCNTSCCLKMLHLGHLTAKNFWTLPSLTLNILSVAAPLWEFWKIHPTRSWVHIKSCWTILTREDLCRNQNHSFPLLRDPNISRLFDTAAKKFFFFL